MRLPSAVAGLLVLAATAGCGDSPVGLPRRDSALAVGATALVLQPGDTLRVGFVLRVGDNAFQSPPVRYPEPTDLGEWTSRDADVAAVGSGGLVTALAPGTTRVVARVGALMDSATVTVVSPGLEPAADYTHVALGGTHACALTTGGVTHCWGSNWYGELGTGQAKRYTAYLSPVRAVGGEQYVALTAGTAYTCGLTGDGRVFCWGNRGGPTEATLNTVVPTQVAGPVRFAQITAGGDHVCGLTAGGRAYCWGRNDAGQLGTGTRITTTTPQAVATDLLFESISAGIFHTCAVSDTGSAYCWGNNTFGQLGTGAVSLDVLAPVPVSGGLRFRSIAAGTLQTCAVADDARALCWGLGTNGQLGTGGDTPSSATPRHVLTDARFAALSVRGDHACGVAVDGSAYCWGSNRAGQLGNGVEVGRLPTPTFNPYIEPQPVPVSGGLTFSAIAAGAADFSCGLASGGRLYCWGNNDLGQLGTGRKRVPVGPEYTVSIALETTPALVRRP